mgnify:CR=1 FL=1
MGSFCRGDCLLGEDFLRGEVGLGGFCCEGCFGFVGGFLWGKVVLGRILGEGGFCVGEV